MSQHIGKIEALDVASIENKISKGAASLFISDERQEEIINSIHEAASEMEHANQEIDVANDKLTSSDSLISDGESKTTDAKSSSQKAQNMQNSAPSESEISVFATNAESSASFADTQDMTIQQAQGQVELVNANLQSQEGVTSGLDTAAGQASALMNSSASIAAEIDELQNDGNDGTGVGTSSAYSLKTAVEAEEIKQKEQNKGNDNTLKADAKLSQIQANASQADMIMAQAAMTGAAIQASTQQGSQAIIQQQPVSDSVTASGEQEKSGLDQTMEVTKKIAGVGSAMDTAGTVLNAVGVGLQAAGVTTVATGGAVTTTGGVLSGIGAGLTALGAPLCAVFGAGVPIVAAGGTTTAGGATTTATGGTVMTVGGTLNGTGKAINVTAKSLTTAGKAIKIGTNAAQTVVNAAQGKWDKAITSAASLAVSTTSTMKSVSALSKATDGKLEKIADFVDSHKNIVDKAMTAAYVVKDGTSVVNDIKNGDVVGAIADATSAISFGTGFIDGNNTAAIIGDVANGISGAAAAYNDAKNGADGFDIAMDVASSLANFDAAGARASGRDFEIVTDKGEKIVSATDKESNFFKTAGTARSAYDALKSEGKKSKAPDPITGHDL